VQIRDSDYLRYCKSAWWELKVETNENEGLPAEASDYAIAPSDNQRRQEQNLLLNYPLSEPRIKRIER